MSVWFVEVGRGVLIAVKSAFVVGGFLVCGERSSPKGCNPNRNQMRQDISDVSAADQIAGDSGPGLALSASRLTSHV